ncbi:MAG: GvpL/GvpF family gas vesicle protein, partial [Deltaproteobacteria bacterium]|nr:GvpL/GvpF family gas vesicle protein [Deltaproteobacteria bacterium]
LAQPASLSLSFLVPRARVQAFREAFDRFGMEPAASSLSGPWPPYSFVTP